MRVDEQKALNCLNHLVECNSIRAIERLLDIHRDTILDLLILAGERCERLLEKRIRGIVVKDVQADEIWGYVYCKEKTKNKLGYGDDQKVGDAYCYVGIERNSKLVLAWHLGRRTVEDTEAFIEKLNHGTADTFQLSTDCWRAYPDAVSYILGTRVRFGQVFKQFVKAHPQQSPEGERRYSPAKVAQVTKFSRFGYPDPARICTSHVERHNKTIRTMTKRMARLTDAYSKKWDNLKAAFALYFAHYNFCRIHSTIHCTPAMEAGITNHIWELRELLEN